jgi:hypothetical protein
MIKRLWVCDQDGVAREVKRCLVVGDDGVTREVSLDEAYRLAVAHRAKASRVFLVIAALLGLSQLALLLRLWLYG